MFIIRNFPKRIAGHTKCPRGPHAARVFETSAFDHRYFQNWSASRDRAPAMYQNIF